MKPWWWFLAIFYKYPRSGNILLSLNLLLNFSSNILQLEYQISLKTTWLRRLILRPEAPWSKLFELIMNNTINNFIILGPEYFIKAKNRATNNFWA